jgi:RNA ligase (TIGR02306 family)
MENQNSVCYVAKINEVRAIEGADNIELVIAGGWNAITKKGEFNVGSLTVIATTDAVIPQELSDRMEVTNYLRKGQRVRTVKLRGVYSECLLIPVENSGLFPSEIYDGKDMMEILSITKYEPPVKQIQLASGRKIKYKDNPNFGVYYKFPNLKNVTGMFTEEDNVQITRKIHGTNARYGIVKKTTLSRWDKLKKFFRVANKWIDYEYVYGSHNCEKGSDSQGFYSTDVWRTVADKYNIRRMLWDHVDQIYDYTSDLGSGIVLYGEIYGAGIQTNYDYGLTDIEFIGFDVVVNGKYENAFNSVITTGLLGLPCVEELYTGKWSQAVQDKYVFKNFIPGTKVPHEGIVIKEWSGARNKVAKVINPDYLIYGEKHDVGDSH